MKLSMKKIKEIWNSIFNRWTPWELLVKDMQYIKTTYSSPIFGGYLIDQKSVTVDVYVKKNRYTGKLKRKFVEKKH